MIVCVHARVWGDGLLDRWCVRAVARCWPGERTQGAPLWRAGGRRRRVCVHSRTRVGALGARFDAPVVGWDGPAGSGERVGVVLLVRTGASDEVLGLRSRRVLTHRWWDGCVRSRLVNAGGRVSECSRTPSSWP